jgi:hypothetical protein
LETDGEDRLYVANFYDSSILIFNASASGDEAPALRIQGALTDLTNNTGLAVDSSWNFYSQNANAGAGRQRWMRFPAQFSASSGSSGANVGSTSAPTFKISITPTDGTVCSKSSESARGGTWTTLPGASDCTPPATKPNAKLLGWATSPTFPIGIAKRQVDNGWGAYETFNADGQLTGVFIPAGGETLVSAAGNLYPIWSE